MSKCDDQMKIKSGKREEQKVNLFLSVLDQLVNECCRAQQSYHRHILSLGFCRGSSCRCPCVCDASLHQADFDSHRRIDNIATVDFEI